MNKRVTVISAKARRDAEKGLTGLRDRWQAMWHREGGLRVKAEVEELRVVLGKVKWDAVGPEAVAVEILERSLEEGAKMINSLEEARKVSEHVS